MKKGFTCTSNLEGTTRPQNYGNRPTPIPKCRPVGRRGDGIRELGSFSLINLHESSAAMIPSCFGAACAQELEAVVAKRGAGLYRPGDRGWVKIKNREYWRYEMERESAITKRRPRVRSSKSAALAATTQSRAGVFKRA